MSRSVIDSDCEGEVTSRYTAETSCEWGSSVGKEAYCAIPDETMLKVAVNVTVYLCKALSVTANV